MLRRALAIVCLLASAPASAQEAPPHDAYLRALSPLTPEIVHHLRDVAASNPHMRDNVFAKLGDSATVNWAFMSCFGTGDIDLDGRDYLMETIEHFRSGGRVFRRESLGAQVGWSSYSLVMGGAAAPIYRELRDVYPRFALVMFGTNDLQGRRLGRYAHYMWTIVEKLLDRGVIPIMSTIMPRGDDPGRDLLVPYFNAVVRGIADGMQVPYVDVHSEFTQLPNQGLAGDGVHPNTLLDGRRPVACDLTPDGLQHGANLRNLLNILMLDRVRRTVIEGEAAPDPPAPPLQGDGSARSPWVIDDGRFTDMRNLAHSQHRGLDGVSGCEGAPDRSGPENVYRLVVRDERPLWIRLVNRREAQAALFLYDADAARCLQWDEDTLDTTLSPGTYDVVVDSPAEGFGKYLLMVQRSTGGETDG